MRKQVYLSGPITHVDTPEQAAWWTEAVNALDDLGLHGVNPMDFGIAGQSPEFIMQYDLNQIDQCDALLVHAHRPSWGAAMELFHAREVRCIPAVALVNGADLSAWLRKGTPTFTTATEAAVYLYGLLMGELT